MTREEFIDGVTTWWELKDICYETDCDFLCEVYDDVGRDDEINYFIENTFTGDWEDLRDSLMDIPTGRGYFLRNTWDDWEELSETDFERFKNDVMEWIEERGLFDDEEEEECTEEEEVEEEVYEEGIEEDDADLIEDEGLDVSFLTESCKCTVIESAIKKKQDEEDERRRQEEAELQMLRTWYMTRDKFESMLNCSCRYSEFHREVV